MNDRFILIKYHLLPLFGIVTCYSYRPTNDYCRYGAHKEAQKQRQFYRLCGESNDICEIFIDLVRSLIEITEQDQVLLSLLLIILLFSPSLSMIDNESLFQDSLSVYQVQSYYTSVMWNYMVSKKK